MNLSEYTVSAVVTYYSHQSQSRAIPVSSGYQPKVHFNDERWAVEYSYALDDLVYPGDRVEVSFRFYDTHVPITTLYKGMAFELMRGEEVVGEGTILEIE